MLNQQEKILLSFLLALITFGVLVSVYQLTMYLYSVFGIMAILCLAGFIVIWLIWYLIVSK